MTIFLDGRCRVGVYHYDQIHNTRAMTFSAYSNHTQLLQHEPRWQLLRPRDEGEVLFNNQTKSVDKKDY